MPENLDSETFGEILKRKKGIIKYAPLPPGSPSWETIKGETWKSIKRKAKQRKTGYTVYKKLLLDIRFDKESK